MNQLDYLYTFLICKKLIIFKKKTDNNYADTSFNYNF